MDNYTIRKASVADSPILSSIAFLAKKTGTIRIIISRNGNMN